MSQVTERPPNGASSVTCQAAECSSPAKARGWCSKHYMRLRRTGDPERVRKPGPVPSQARATIRAFNPEMSERTFSRYIGVFDFKVNGLIDQEQLEAAILKASRPGGRINVSKMRGLAEAALIRNVISGRVAA